MPSFKLQVCAAKTKIHLWQGSIKITFHCFAHWRKVKPPFDIMRAQTRLQANYERNSYVSPNSSETQISAEKVPHKCFIQGTKFVPG